MKKLLILLIVLCLPYFGYTKWIKGEAAAIAFDADQIVITKGDNTYHGTPQSDYEADLRVYGIENGFGDGGWNPIGHATHLFMALPAEQIDAPDVCESRAVAKASFINFYVQEAELRERIDAVAQIDGRRCVRVWGKQCKINSFFYKDENHSSSLTRQGKMDPRYLVVLNDIEVIPCD